MSKLTVPRQAGQDGLPVEAVPVAPEAPSLLRRVGAELLGTAALVAVAVGSGIQASSLTTDGGLQLLVASLATACGLGVLIALLGPVSGGHLNPVVTLAAWWTNRGRGLSLREVAAYLAAQMLGAIGGSVLADAMFAQPLVRFSTHDRSAPHLLLGELVATAGLVLLVCGLARAGQARFTAAAVGAYVVAAYWFTSSSGFTNPAATIGRTFTDTFGGIAPGSVLPFVGAQLLGAVAGLLLLPLVFGSAAGVADAAETAAETAATGAR